MAAGAAVAAGLLSAAGVRALIPVLRRRDLLDRPNERSSHRVPTPRGGGLALLTAVLLVWAGFVAAGRAPPAIGAVLIAAVVLATVSWIDDLHGLSPLLRLTVQTAAVAIGLAGLPELRDVPGWPLGAAFLAGAGLLWLWWVNAFNFMDGIDGLAGAEAAAIGAGLAAIGGGSDPVLMPLAAAVAGGAVGFLLWNWAPARIFLGDVGSTALGYLTGFLLLGFALRGHWRAALILPLYFLADATITLLRRLLRGERVWQAHRQHFYQHAVGRGLGHGAVAGRVAAADLLLIGCAWAAERGWGAAALGLAAVVVGVLLLALARGW